MIDPKQNPANCSCTHTVQEGVWKSDFGRDYTDRNTFDIQSLEDLWVRNYGVSRSEINDQFLTGIAKTADILEVGCNAGNQLLLLSKMGWSSLTGIELQPYALEIARSRLPHVTLAQGSALALPWTDSSFDLVFTSGVLIHVSPEDLPKAMGEIYRVTREYIWCSEYFAPQVTRINYRERADLLWKMDFARQFLRQFPDLELVKERRLPYLQSTNVDTVFLLKKKNSSS